MAMTTAERQRAYKARQKAGGLIAVSMLVHPSQASGLYQLAKLLASDADLEVVVQARNLRTGRFQKP